MHEFAQTVNSPWRAGMSFGEVGSAKTDGLLLPSLLQEEQGATFSFIAGYVGSRYHRRGPRGGSSHYR